MEHIKLSPGLTEFAVALYKEISKDPGNVFLSPFSISTALSMVLLGTQGQTREQLFKTLNLDGISENEINSGFSSLQACLKSSKVVLETANQLFPEISFPLEEEFLSKCKKYHDADIKGLDFVGNPENSRNAINQWVENVTKGKITDLLPSGSINSLVRLVIANAVYFKGDWLNPFKEGATVLKDFHVQKDVTKKVHMMSMERKFPFNYDSNLDLHVVELPYVGEKVSMVVFVPAKRFGLEEIAKNLTATKITELISGLFEEKVYFSMPKMKFEKSLDLVGILKKLGLVDIFDREKANLEGISKTGELFVSQVQHKAFLEVDEKGTVAAAATAVVMMLRSLPVPPVRVTCDHPFLFVIRHKPSRNILFMGRYSGP